MTRTHDLGPALLAYALLLPTTPALAAPPAAPRSLIEMWVRGADGAHQKPATVDLDSVKLVETRHADVQYEGTFAFRGIPVAALIDRYAPPPAADLALLRFSGGMIVPLPFRDARAMARLDPLVARAMRTADGAPWQPGVFPPIARKVDAIDTKKPIEFTAGNHVAVADRWHPDVPDKYKAQFSPWPYTDSLAAIEFVSRAAWYRQFDVDADPAVRAGAQKFRESCQFCHGARKVGASFGWDFVEPEPIYGYRKSGRSLLFHVKYRGTSPSELSRQMPAIAYLGEDEARALWQWLKALSDKPMPPYRP